MTNPDFPTLLSAAEVAQASAKLKELVARLDAIVFGREEVTTAAALSLVCRGHMLFEGMPGLGKTELARGLARLMALSFKRIQFTPDLMPSDITGSHLIEEDGGRRRLVFKPGPVFAGLVLADEINRASPKTQSALLEAMQERSVTVLGETHALPEPFVVIATQNPIDLEGTYPLPEAQLDRFLFKIEVVGTPVAVLERLLRERPRGEPPAQKPLMDAAELKALMESVSRVALPRAVGSYIARLVAATHPSEPAAPAGVKTSVRFGASPRAAIGLGLAARAYGLLEGRPQAGFADVRRAAPLVLRHRLILDPTARLSGRTAHHFAEDILAGVSVTGRELPDLAVLEKSAP